MTASNSAGLQEYSQSFQYDAAGRMRYNSRVGTYVYSTSAPDHAPSSLTRFDGRGNALSYDSNGNMLTGLNGKTMTYDAENRPLSVNDVSGGLTTYTYGADGRRLKKTEDGDVTLYIGSIEIRKFGQANAEQLISYPTGSIKLVDGALSVLHKDQLSSVRGVSGADGAIDERVTYRPFGEPTERDHDAGATNDSKRFIGERYDADAGLMYLNARYYDPELAIFIQPDWFEVTKLGVGTNRYSYSFNDPVNLSDPSGNASFWSKVLKRGASKAVNLGYDKAYEAARSDYVRRNAAKKAGETHERSGVIFDEEGFPDFSDYLYEGVDKFGNPIKSDVNIGRLLDKSPQKHFDLANKKAGLKETPDGYTWHHHQDSGRMQLVRTSKHRATGHTGGAAFQRQAVAVAEKIARVADGNAIAIVSVMDPIGFVDHVFTTATGHGIFSSKKERFNSWCQANPSRCM